MHGFDASAVMQPQGTSIISYARVALLLSSVSVLTLPCWAVTGSLTSASGSVTMEDTTWEEVDVVIVGNGPAALTLASVLVSTSTCWGGDGCRQVAHTSGETEACCN